jgi:cold shock CspA family protein
MKFWRDGTSWGMCDGDDGDTYFVHANEIRKKPDEYVVLEMGEQIEFDIRPAGARGRNLRAVNIRRMS